MITTIKAIGSHRTIRITCADRAIDAPWNYFQSVSEAQKYADDNMVLFPGHAYGIVDIKSDQWNFV